MHAFISETNEFHLSASDKEHNMLQVTCNANDLPTDIEKNQNYIIYFRNPDEKRISIANLFITGMLDRITRLQSPSYLHTFTINITILDYLN